MWYKQTFSALLPKDGAAKGFPSVYPSSFDAFERDFDECRGANCERGTRHARCKLSQQGRTFVAVRGGRGGAELQGRALLTHGPDGDRPRAQINTASAVRL